LKIEPVADWELDKVRMKVRLRQAQELYSSRSRANALGFYTVYYNEPDLINTAVDKVAQVTKSDLQRVAGAYLVTGNRTVLTTLPKSKPASSTPPGSKS
jgi:predicted Zn-dependent peptidase